MQERVPADWPTTSERLLGELVEGRNSEAWSYFAQIYGAVLQRFCERRGLQPVDAEDVVQQVLVAVSRQIANFEVRPDKGRFRSWLATIANRAAWRTKQRLTARAPVSLEQIPELEEPTDSSWKVDFNEAVLEVLLDRLRRSLSELEYAVFERTWKKNERAADVARDLQRPLGWVYRVGRKAEQRLRQEIEFFSADIIDPEP